LEGESNSLNTPSLLDFQSDTGEYDLMIITKCPTSGVWAELHAGTSLHVHLLSESRNCRVRSTPRLLNIRAYIPRRTSTYPTLQHPSDIQAKNNAPLPCSDLRRLNQSAGSDGPPRSKYDLAIIDAWTLPVIGFAIILGNHRRLPD
jgi:hypothetical protein